MPYSMFKHHLQFINADYVNVPINDEYWSWIETMYTHFGGRFLRLFRGPCLHHVPRTDWHPSKILFSFNRLLLMLPVLGGQPLLKRISKDTRFTPTTDIQEAALTDVAANNPGGRYWILSDATDLKTCLQESRKQQWNGDVDMNDGKVEQMKVQYDAERKDIKEMTNAKTGREKREEILEQVLRRIDGLKVVLGEGVKESREGFNAKVDKKATNEETLMRYCWNMTEWMMLRDQTYEMEKKLINLQKEAAKGENIKGSLMELEEDLLKLHMNIYKKKRTAASHVLVFFIAHEERTTKPYGIPVRFLACNTIQDKKHRELVDELKEEMVRHGLKPVGSVTDGEFHSSRYASYQGQDVSIFGIMQNAKSLAQTLNIRQLMGMILPQQQHGPDGQYKAIVENEFVPQDHLEFVANEMKSNPDFIPDDLVEQLIGRILPGDNKPSAWKCGEEDTLLQSLRTLMATYIYLYKLNKNKAKGRDFSTFPYIPPVDKNTNDYFHNRGDQCHIHRRIATHTRKGGNGLRMEAFTEILQDKEAGLTEAALRGHDKQSSVDAEALLSYSVADALGKRGYYKEEEYVRKIAQWHEASDGRAAGRDLTRSNLSEEEEKEERRKCQDTRAKYNKEMLSYIIQHWMPWQGSVCNYRLIDINKPLKGILGWSRETIIEVITNISSQEFRRQQPDLPPEHPRAGTTDIVEAGFATLRLPLEERASPSNNSAHIGSPTAIYEITFNGSPDLYKIADTCDDEFAVTKLSCQQEAN
ncbi:uncharacterized protein [Amphiura filiformis]|uniref:uncharacterized protein n=1 Tax=Amphiura filiformis TaxID=82378 RepID=UPI003B20D8CE